MSFAYVDSETRCAVPIEHGTDLYTKNAQSIIWTFTVEDEPVGCWDVTDEPMPNRFHDIVSDERITLIAHHAPFDRGILTHADRIPTPEHRWRCTRAQAYSHGLPGHLGALGAALGLPPDKQKLIEDGKLIRVFCCPQDDGSFIQPLDRPGDWERFKGYAIRDTEALREVHRRLPMHNYQGDDLETWWLDQLINERGFGFDPELATVAVDFLARAKKITDKKMSDKTQGAVQAATQRDKLLNYIASKGVVLPNMRAATIQDWLEMDDLDPLVRYLLETRLEAAKSAGSKFKRGLTMRSPDNRLRQLIQFAGAGRTGRSSHKGFQPGNMARPVMRATDEKGRYIQVPVKAKYIDEVIIPGIYSGAALDNDLVYGGPNEAAALALRHTIVAAPGNEQVVADFSNVESRKLAWLANETWKLEQFRAIDAGTAPDAYKTLYVRFFGGLLDEVNDTKRQSAKVTELAAGFGGSVGALVTMAADYSMDLDLLPALVIPSAKDENLKKATKAWRRALLMNEDYGLEKDVFIACHLLIQAYREANKSITQLRHDMGRSVKEALRAPGTLFDAGRCVIWASGTALIIKLPSGRRLIYWGAKIEKEMDLDPETGKEVWREYVSYKTPRGTHWMREKAWDGLFVQNVVQASANDLLRDAMRALHKDTLTVPRIAEYLATLPPRERTAICLQIHDEIVLDVPRGSYPLERMIKVITTSSPWAVGLPMAANGWIHERYGKR